MGDKRLHSGSTPWQHKEPDRIRLWLFTHPYRDRTQLKALVEAKLGNTDSAIRYAQLAAQGAKEAGDFYFAQSVESTIAELPPSSAGTTPLGEGNA